jgi:hypothetical protein
MDTADDSTQARGKAYDGSDFVITKRRWRHTIDRHPELERLIDAVLQGVESPDEAYVDRRGTIHLLKALKGGPSDFLVVVVRKEARETYLVTAYGMGSRRKKRGYRAFKKLPLS